MSKLLENAPAKDWRVKVIVDRGPGQYYRYHLTIENLNFAPESSDYHCTWSVPTLDDPRYDTSGAVWDNPSCVMEKLSEGDRFRYAGYPVTGTRLTYLGRGRYRDDDGREWSGGYGSHVVKL